MRTGVIFLIVAGLCLSIDSGIAGDYCYQSTPEQDQAISIAANEDGISPEEAFSRIVHSALEGILDKLKKENERRMINDARKCADRMGIFEVDVTKGMPQWQCIRR